MEQLIKIHPEYKGLGRVISARELHEFLGSKQRFADWISNRIEKYGFVENQDYCRFHKVMKGDSNGHGNKKTIEYALTIDTAKELAMVEANEKGQQARRYFIECERQLQSVVSQTPAIPQTYAEALRLAAALDAF